ncbi:MAG: hypothetical protein HYU70_13045 [Bacteroidetes bacterium]|nr:hypothetical protein [Bacteroidota bacterium]
MWIVEDDLDDLVLLEKAFEDTQVPCHVVIFSNTISAHQQLSTCPTDKLPGIILSDYNMPMTNDEELIESLCTHKRYENIIKVIVSTSSDLFGKEAVCKRVCMPIPEIRKDQAENYSRGC